MFRQSLAVAVSLGGLLACAAGTLANEPELPAGAVRIGSTRLREPGGWHKRIHFLDDGKTVLTVGNGVAIRYWDVETGSQPHEIALPGGYMDAAFSRAANLLAITGLHIPDGDDAKATAVLWLFDTKARKSLRMIPLPGDRGGNHRKVRLGTDGKRAFVEYEGDVRVIDTKSGEVLTQHDGRVNAGATAVSPDGKWIAFGRGDVFVWDWDSGDPPKKIASLGGGGTENVLFGMDGRTLYVAEDGGIVSVREVATGRKLRTLDIGERPRSWAFAPDGTSLAVAYYDSSQTDSRAGAVHVWNAESGNLLSQFAMGRQPASGVAWSPDGSRLAAVTDHRVWAWDVKAGRVLGPDAAGHDAAVTAFAFGSDGRLFTGSDDHTVRSWDAAGKPGLRLVHDAWVRGVAISADGSLVAGSALRNDLRIWDANTGLEKFRLLGNGSMGGTRRLRFTPDGKRLVAWGDDLYLRLWDMKNGKLLAEHRTLPDGVTEENLNDPFRRDLIAMMGTAADLSPDGSAFAFAQYRTVQVLDVATGKERSKFTADESGITALAFSPDGKTLAVAGRGRTIETPLPNGLMRVSRASDHQTAVWDLASQKIRWQVQVPGSWARGVQFTGDGERLAEIIDPDDKTNFVQLRDSATGKEIGRVELPRRGSHFAFDRTGKRMTVAFADATAIVYDVATVLKPAK